MKTNLKYYYNEGYKIKIGYSIFRYVDGRLYALAAASLHMYYSTYLCDIFQVPPTHYFKPYEGDFIIKTTRIYSDLEILEYSGHKSNYNFIQK